MCSIIDYELHLHGLPSVVCVKTFSPHVAHGEETELFRCCYAILVKWLELLYMCDETIRSIKDFFQY